MSDTIIDGYIILDETLLKHMNILQSDLDWAIKLCHTPLDFVVKEDGSLDDHTPSEDHEWLCLAEKYRELSSNIIPLDRQPPPYTIIWQSKRHELLQIGQEVFPGYTDSAAQRVRTLQCHSKKQKLDIVDIWKGFKAQADAILRSPDHSQEIITVLGQLDDARSSLYELQLGIDTGSVVLTDDLWFDLSSTTDALKKEAGRLWWNVPEQQRNIIPNVL